MNAAPGHPVPVTIVGGWDVEARATLFEALLAAADTSLTPTGPGLGVLVAALERCGDAHAVIVESTDAFSAACELLEVHDRGGRGHPDAVVVAVDAPRAATRLAIGHPVTPDRSALCAVASADRIALVGAELLTQQALIDLVDALALRSPRSSFHSCVAGQPLRLPPAMGFDPAHAARRARAVCSRPGAPVESRTTVALRICGRVDPDLFQGWLHALGEQGVIRVDGGVPLGGGARWLVQMVRDRVDLVEERVRRPAPVGRLVVVAPEIDAEITSATLAGTIRDA